MSEPAAARVACPACGNQYRWASEIAGRKVACKCGAVLRMPAEAGSLATLEKPKAAPSPKPAPPRVKPAADDDYELADPNAAHLPAPATGRSPTRSPAPASSGRCPSCGQGVKPTAVICVNCGFNLAEGKKLKTDVAVEDDASPPAESPAAKATLAKPLASRPSLALMAGPNRAKAAQEDAELAARQAKITDIYGPLGLVGAGLLFIAFDALILVRMTPAYAAAEAGTSLLSPGALHGIEVAKGAVNFIITLPFLFIGIIALVKMFGASFGPLLTALLKLAAIAMFTVGVALCVETGLDIITEGFGGMGGYLSLAINFAVFWAVCAWLFELESLEVMVLFLIVNFLPFVLLMFAGAAIYSMFG